MKKNLHYFIMLFVLLQVVTSLKAQTGDELEFQKWAITPPMGWNSWDCYGPSVIEDSVKVNADYMAANLLEYGWEYVVVDIRWYVDNQTGGSYLSYGSSDFVYDSYGRYMPSTTRFPSASDGNGFTSLADYVHSLGLKFGIHIMRGVPKVAVENKLPILGTDKTAADIYSTNSECTWLTDNYTIDATKDGAQEYYNSIFDLYASWGVDFVKVDDLSRPYHDDEIELIRNAIDQTGREMVLSMSPGATPLSQYEHAKNHANMWRTVDDFWDNWSQLSYSFIVCADWAPYISPGGWPDADMLPLGRICLVNVNGDDRQTNFTEAEQYTLMTLWTIFKSPLMFGGNLPDNDSFTNSLITNDEVLEMHQISVNNEELFSKNGTTAWTADDPTNGDKFLALFNNSDNGDIKTSNLLYRSGTIATTTDGYGVDIDVSIPEGSNELYLVVDDVDDYDCDHADWINPTIYTSDGDTVLLTDLDWEYATSGYGSTLVNQSVSGSTLSILDTEYENGIGTHAVSVILYSIPENTTRFTAFAGLDDGGTDQDCGSTVEFMVSVTDPTTRDVNTDNAIANSGRISRTMNSEGVNLTADISGAEKLYLVVTDAGDNYNYDHADWINPTIYKENGDSIILPKDMDWVSATDGWSEVHTNTSEDGATLTVNGTTYDYGYGVNAYSIIEFDVPDGYTTFKSLCCYDDEVKNATSGVTIEFMVFTEDPTVFEDSVDVDVDFGDLDIAGNCTIRDMWAKTDLGTFTGTDFAPAIVKHGAGLYRISPSDRSNDSQISLTSSDNEVSINTSFTLSASVTNSNITPSGWIQIYEGDSLIANVETTSGCIEFSYSCATAGTYTFYSNYGGNTKLSAVQSGSITVKVAEESNDATNIESNLEGNRVYIQRVNNENYINGLQEGDLVKIYNLKGDLLSEFIATSDTEKVNSTGFTIIVVTSDDEVYRLKAVQ